MAANVGRKFERIVWTQYGQTTAPGSAQPSFPNHCPPSQRWTALCVTLQLTADASAGSAQPVLASLSLLRGCELGPARAPDEPTVSGRGSERRKRKERSDGAALNSCKIADSK